MPEITVCSPRQRPPAPADSVAVQSACRQRLSAATGGQGRGARRVRFCVALVLAGALVLPAAGPAVALEIGDPAPPLSISSWIKGAPVDLAGGKGKKIYVVEFWATWCGPCIQSIPHLTELQEKYGEKGVVVLGISDESTSVVRPFVERMGEKIGYTIATDSRDATARRYMGGVGAQGIPYSFVVDKSGAIAWHGHPSSGLERVLERMAAGKFDIQIAKREAEALRLAEQYFQLVGQSNTVRDSRKRAQLAEKARKTGLAVLEKAKQSPDLLNEFAWQIVMFPRAEHRDLELAEQASEAAFKASDRKPPDRARKLIHDYFRTVQGIGQSGEPDENTGARLQEISSQLLELGDPQALDEFAWAMMAVPDLKYRDLQLALRAAEAANKAADEKNVTFLDTYARALFETGQRAKAIEYARKAVQVNKDKRLEPTLKQSLERYMRATAGPAAEG